jgi:hypothetical protein
MGRYSLNEGFGNEYGKSGSVRVKEEKESTCNPNMHLFTYLAGSPSWMPQVNQKELR